MTALIAWLRRLWCDWTHGGGRITRDPYGMINWRCDTCGRWGTPTPVADEDRVIDRDIEKELRRRARRRDTP